MTPACPRCRAPLHGPVCAACGLNVHAQFGAPGAPGAPPGPPPGPPPHGYAPPQGYPPGPTPSGQAQYIGPGGVPYVMVPVPQQLPSNKWGMTGGIMCIVTSSIHLLGMLLALAGAAASEGDQDKAGAVAAIVVYALVCIGGIIAGAYAVKARWGGALAGGILHSLITLLILLGLVGMQEARDDVAPIDRGEVSNALDAATGIVAVFALLSLITAIFCYAGIRGARARARYKSHVSAAQAF